MIIEDARMSTILRKLKGEIFVLSIDRELATAPQMKGFQMKLREDCELEVSLEEGSSVNAMFDALNAEGITVTSMRNKSNRLEELFMRLVNKNQGDSSRAGRTE